MKTRKVRGWSANLGGDVLSGLQGIDGGRKTPDTETLCGTSQPVLSVFAHDAGSFSGKHSVQC